MSVVVPQLNFVGVNRDKLEEFADDSDPPNKFVFHDDKVYLVSEPWIPLERLKYIDIEDGKEYQFIGGEMRVVLEAGIGGALARILLRVGSAGARLRNIVRAKHIFKWNKEKRQYELAAGVGIGTLIAFGLRQGAEVGRSVAMIVVMLIQTKLFLNFIAEEAIAAASMSCYIASGRDPEILEKSIENYEKTIKIGEDVIMFAEGIPILTQLQLPFVAFLDASKDALQTYKHVLYIAKQRAKMERAGKRAALVYIYTNVSARIIVDGLYVGRYAPSSVRVAPGTRKIRLEKKNFQPYETTITLSEFEIKHLGSLEEPIILIPVEKKEKKRKQRKKEEYEEE